MMLMKSVMERAGKHQILVFVLSRKDIAKIIRDMVQLKDELHKFVSERGMAKEILD